MISPAAPATSPIRRAESEMNVFEDVFWTASVGRSLHGYNGVRENHISTAPPQVMIGYAQEIHWTDLRGRTQSIRVEGCQTAEEVRAKAIDMAEMSGWTPPRWWQWWRWNDTRVPQIEPTTAPKEKE